MQIYLASWVILVGGFLSLISGTELQRSRMKMYAEILLLHHTNISYLQILVIIFTLCTQTLAMHFSELLINILVLPGLYG